LSWSSLTDGGPTIIRIAVSEDHFYTPIRLLGPGLYQLRAISLISTVDSSSPFSIDLDKQLFGLPEILSNQNPNK